MDRMVEVTNFETVSQQISAMNMALESLYDTIKAAQEEIDISIGLHKELRESQVEFTEDEVVNFAQKVGRLAGLKEAYKIVNIDTKQ